MEEKNTNENIAEETAETVSECECECECGCDKAETAADAECTEDKAEQSEKSEKKDKKKSDKADKKLKSEIEALKAELSKKDAAIAEANDKHLRLMAEYDNFRRRSREEKDAVYSAAVADAVSELLPLFDNLELASKYTGDNAADAAKGVEMILSSVPAILEKLNVTSFGEAGDAFDPNIHNAVMHIEDENYGENEIVDVFQKGYKHGDKIVRFAVVRVAN